MKPKAIRGGPAQVSRDFAERMPDFRRAWTDRALLQQIGGLIPGYGPAVTKVLNLQFSGLDLSKRWAMVTGKGSEDDDACRDDLERRLLQRSTRETHRDNNFVSVVGLPFEDHAVW